MIGNNLNVVPSIVPGSTVITNRTVELVKLGHMFLVQKVFTGIDVDSTIDFLMDLSAVTADFIVLYEFSFSISQGKAVATFYEKGNYAGGSVVPIQKKNENKVQTANTVLTKDPIGTVPGPEGTSYLTGGEAQGNNLAGGERLDKDTPTEINSAIDRLLRIVHSGGASESTFDLDLRILFAEIP